jgi:predicted RNA-binding protein Jag
MGPKGSMFEGKTLDDAVRKGLDKLGLSRAEATINVVEEGSGGFLGFGAKPYKVIIMARPGGPPRDDEGDRDRDRERRGGGGRSRSRSEGGREGRRGRGEASSARGEGGSSSRGEGSSSRGEGSSSRGERNGRSRRGGEGRSSEARAGGSREGRGGERGPRGRGGERSRGGERTRTEREPRPQEENDQEVVNASTASPAPVTASGGEGASGDDENKRRRRRGRRGGRGRRGERRGPRPEGAESMEGDQETSTAPETRSAPETRTAPEPQSTPEPQRAPERQPMPPAEVVSAPVASAPAPALRQYERAAVMAEAEAPAEVSAPLAPPRAERPTAEPSMDEAALAESGKRWTQDLMKVMGFDAKVSSVADGDRVDVTVEVSEKDDLLTGPKGEVRQAMQHLLNRMVNRGEGSRYHLQLEVNDFWKQREDELCKMAEGLAQEAIDKDDEVVTEYLNSQERRIVHMTLREDARVKTYALGTGMIKRVAIAPADFPESDHDDD